MLNQDEKIKLELFALEIRRETIKEIASLGVGHIGGAMSIADLLAVLYGKQMKYDSADPNMMSRDRLVLSKGHAGPALYAALALKGFFPKDWLMTLNRPGTHLPSHCDRLRTPGIDATTGSLGQGISIAAGMALGMRMEQIDSYVYCILGDGECNEGQIWETALFAGHQKLEHLIGFVDYNRQMMDGWTQEICDLGNIGAKFREFGWEVQEIDGHDVSQIDNAIETAKQNDRGPSMIILDTIKAKGLKKYEKQPNNHNSNISQEELVCFLNDFDIIEQEIRRKRI